MSALSDAVRCAYDQGYAKGKQDAERVGWISVEDRMPEEHDSMFAQFYGTDRWNKAMFRKRSSEVNVAGVYEDGSKFVTSAKTHDGKWDNPICTIPRTITHWQPLPEPPMDAQEGAECWK